MEDDDLRDVFARLGPITIRRMFGGKGLYADGRIFAIVAFDTIYMKAEGDGVERLRSAGSTPFTYQGKSKPVTVGSYWSLPETALDDADEAAVWARLSLSAAKPRPPSGRQRRKVPM